MDESPFWNQEKGKTDILGSKTIIRKIEHIFIEKHNAKVRFLLERAETSKWSSLVVRMTQRVDF